MSGKGDHCPEHTQEGHLPLECVFAFSPEVVHVGLEVQLKHVVLVDVLRF